MKYRKKPVVIDAWQHHADAGTHTESWPRWLLDACTSGVVYSDRHGETWIKTLEGDHHVSEGDWIIRGIKGELYACKPDIFAATYEYAELDEELSRAWRAGDLP